MLGAQPIKASISLSGIAKAIRSIKFDSEINEVHTSVQHEPQKKVLAVTISFELRSISIDELEQLKKLAGDIDAKISIEPTTRTDYRSDVPNYDPNRQVPYLRIQIRLGVDSVSA